MGTEFPSTAGHIIGKLCRSVISSPGKKVVQSFKAEVIQVESDNIVRPYRSKKYLSEIMHRFRVALIRKPKCNMSHSSYYAQYKYI